MPTPLQVQERVISMPFQIDTKGGVAYDTQMDHLAVQEIQAILLTAQGERVMRPTVGSPFSAQLFSPITSSDSAYVASELLDLLKSQCRYSTVQNIQVDLSKLGVFALNVQYSPIMHDVILVVNVPFTTVFSSTE